MSSERKPSLFAQKMQKFRENRAMHNNICMSTVTPFGNRSYIIEGEEAEIIHRENVNVLSKMSEHEITEKRKNLLQILDPSSVDFLKKKRTVLSDAELTSCLSQLSTVDSQSVVKMNNKGVTTNPQSRQCIRDVISLENYRKHEIVSMDICETAASAEINPKMDIVYDVNCAANRLNIDLELKDRGVHMDVVEPEKLKWMENVPSLTNPLPDTLYNARFDFEGDLLPFIEENRSTCDRGLYHHGEEPQRPGYSIEELYQLTRSSVPRQRIFALNTLAAILEKEIALSSCLETELIKQLLDSGIFLILRFSLDDRLKTVYLAALRTINALLWRGLDMHYLSCVVGIFGDFQLPTFEVVNTVLEEENQSELKDIELINLDIIKGCLRTDLIERMRYILDDPFLEVDHYILIIKCLTRIAYHSYEATAVILNTPSLLETLFLNCQFPMKSSKLYTAKLMVLIRVLASRSYTFAETLEARLKLVPFLLSVIGDEVTKTSTSAQCIYLWAVFLHHGVAVESVAIFSSTFYRLSRQLFSLQIDSMEKGMVVYANALVSFLIFLFDRFAESVQFLVPTFEQLTCQWINVFMHTTEVNAEFTRLVSNCIFLLMRIAPPSSVKSYHSQMKWLLHQPNLCERLALQTHFCSRSFLLNAQKKNFAESLPSLGVPTSILTAENTIIITHSIVKYLRSHYIDKDLGYFIDIIWKHYVIPVLNYDRLNEIATLWPSRFEIHFLYDFLLLNFCQGIKSQRTVLKLAFALLRIIHTDDLHLVQDILSQVLFNAQIFEELGLPAGTDIEHMKKVQRIFEQRIGFSKEKSIILTSTKRGTECALPTDWFYLPILEISNKVVEKGMVEGDDVGFTVKTVLKWIYLIECIADDIETKMSLSTRYCRVCCVFFCDDVFLDVTNLLADILREMMKRNDKLEFRKPIPGISSFHDFFKELCERFASSSYGNNVFASYLMVPLQQKHDSRLRQYIWMEQVIILRFLRLRTDELPVPLSCYLQPCETNVPLVETYLNVIATGGINVRNSPALYHIGLHHVVLFIRSFEIELAAKKLQQKITAIANEKVRNEFLTYSEPF